MNNSQRNHLRKDNQYLIITSPHQLCPFSYSRQDHPCDLAANTASEILCSIASIKGFTCLYLKGNINRRKIDLNREKSRNTNYRKVLTQLFDLFANRKYGRVITLDIHSFPSFYLESAKNINFFNKGELPPEIALIPSIDDKHNTNNLLGTIYNTLSSHDVRVKIIKNIGVNDIMQQSAEHKIPSILIELNEDLLKSQSRLKFICTIIIDSIKNTGLYSS